ncbi:MAG: hypothetical protein K2O34_05190 [Acetatifactor sp.]|nr:hypothetical protein [Acetatifactor sp.]
MLEAEYLDFYFAHIHFQGELQLNAIKIMAEEKGQGAEYVSCSYDKEDEDYREGYVTLYFWKPAVEEDRIVHIDNMTFYTGLAEVCRKDMVKYPEHEDSLSKYLKKIREELHL